MTEPPATRVSLLLRLKDSRDHEAWVNFVEIYAPLVYRYGCRRGLQDADAADLTQDVLRAVARSAGEFRYDPRRGSFRGWLFTVARTKRINLDARRARQPRGSGDSDVLERLHEIPDREVEAGEWDREFEQRLLDWATGCVRTEFKESTWLAFAKTAFDGLSPREVALELQMTLGAVYAARSRVTARLRELIDQARLDSSDP